MSVRGQTETWDTLDDFAICNACGAKWHTYINLWNDKMKWAELVIVGSKGGEGLLGKKYDPEFWRNMAINNREKQKFAQKRKTETDAINHSAMVAAVRETEAKNHTAVREIIKEKEVIVKVRCSYCHKLYDETLDKCPNCGGV